MIVELTFENSDLVGELKCSMRPLASTDATSKAIAQSLQHTADPAVHTHTHARMHC